MTMSREQLRAFISAGEILHEITRTSGHVKRWGFDLPAGLVSRARETLRHYPTALQLKWAADEPGEMGARMAMGAPSPARTQRIYDLLSAVASKVTAAGEAAGRPFDAEAYLIR
jgi:hypothetical protein